ncbi:phosphoribosylanthranilate isomerase [Flavobacterium oreochromis]|uniref:phosphoribosylanthranilate isomerase n=1 Tax=Flavobacterium oreochromis TaxID=2906078 RepID=UPI002164B5C5|nr:phosphoribosylanthranilate isomerase [Flavobacterium oreochromis]
MAIKIKICGMKYPENIQEIASLQPDYLGFIFYEKSARNVEINTLPTLPENIQKVGVFVNATVEEIKSKINQYDLDVLQLHGNESVAFCKEVQAYVETLPKKISLIKVFSVGETFDFSTLLPYEAVCDYFLFDTKGKQHGGNGITFDWKLLDNYPSEKPFFLSGGIGINELEEVKQFLKSTKARWCHALDINSQLEIEPGLKYFPACKKFIEELVISEE